MATVPIYEQLEDGTLAVLEDGSFAILENEASVPGGKLFASNGTQSFSATDGTNRYVATDGDP